MAKTTSHSYKLINTAEQSLLDAEKGPEARAAPGSHSPMLTRTKREHYTLMDEMW